MIEHSASLDELVNDVSQYVNPYASIRFFDNRFLKNLKIDSSNSSYVDKLLSLSPKLLWKPDSTTAIVDISGNKNNGVASGDLLLSEPFSSEKIFSTKRIADNFNRQSLYTLGEAADGETVAPYITDLNRGRWSSYTGSPGRCALWGSSTSYEGIYPDYALVETGGSDGYASANFIEIAYGQGLIFRYVDDNNYCILTVRGSAGSYYLVLEQKVNSNNFDTTIPIPAGGVAPAGIFTGVSSGSHVKVEFQNSFVKIFIDNVLVANRRCYFDKNIKDNGTKHGMGLLGANSEAARWSDFETQAYEEKFSSIYRFGDTTLPGVIQCSPIKNLNLSDNYSITFSVKLEYIESGNSKIFSVEDQSLNEKLSVSFRSLNSIQLNIDNTTYIIFYSKPTGTFQNTWHHFFITKENSTLKIYINGEQALVNNGAPISESFDSQGKIKLFSQVSGSSFQGSVSDFCIFQNVFSSIQISELYDKASETFNSYIYSKNLYSPYQAFNEIEKENLSYGSLDVKDIYNKKIAFNSEFTVSNSLISKEDFAFYSSYEKSLPFISGDFYNFVDQPYIKASFDNVKINKINLTTTSSLGGVGKVNVKIFDINNNQLISFENLTFQNFEINIDLQELILTNYVELTILSTVNPSDHARICSVNLWWEEDVSNDVINLSWSKIKENFESTMPIGSTSANSGNLSLNNTHQKYNVYNVDSPYYGYIRPELKATIALDYVLDKKYQVFERVPLASNIILEQWDVSGDSMTAEIPLVDSSMIFQEMNADEGFVFEDTTAGRACSFIAKSAGVGRMDVDFVDSFEKEILKSRPFQYWRMNDPILQSNFFVNPISNGYTILGKLFRLESENLENALEFLVSENSGQISLNSILLQESRKYDPQYDRSLASLYDITAESVGLESWSSPRSTYTPERYLGDTYAGVCIIKTIDHQAASLQDNFSIEILIHPFANRTSESTILSKYDSTKTLGSRYNYNIFSTFENNMYKIKARISTSVGALSNQDFIVESSPISPSDYENNNFFVALIKNGSNLILKVNENIFTLNNVTGIVETNDKVLTFFQTSTGFIDTKPFLGRISNCSLFDRALTFDELNKHYRSFAANSLVKFNYLYFFDQTYWDGMLDFATADVAMFYFDENNKFTYDHREILNENVDNRYTTVQSVFNEKNIINGSHIVDIEANKIVIKVNPKSRIKNNFQSVWVPKDDESLAITKLTEPVTVNSSVIKVANTESPIWPQSGYFKINNEIIKYNNRNVNNFIELERGYFDTLTSSHSVDDLVRECRSYNIDFAQKPSYSVQFPFISAQIFHGRIDVDLFKSTALGAELVVSASDTDRNNPDTVETNLVFLQGTNPVTEQADSTSISAKPIVEENGQEKVVDEQQIINEIKRFKKKEITIENKFIQNSNYAKDIASFLTQYYGEPVPVLSLSTIGRPFLQLGDKIEIEYFKDLNIFNQNYTVIEMNTEYDGGVVHEFKLKKIKEL
jgi:hypothetical protein